MIVSGGEALVDLVPAGPDGAMLAPRLGGGPYNVALTAARLGVPSAFLSRVSTDGFGEALVRRLEESGVDTSLVQRGPEPTTLAVVTLDDDSSARYSFYTEGTADRLVADPGPLPAATTALSVGTLGMVLDPGARSYEAVLRREHRRGVLTALDPNIRAEMIADPDAYRARFASWLPSVSVLKVSEEDAAWLAADGDVERAVRSWLDAGPAAVVLTRGARGVSLVTSSGVDVTVPTVPVDVVDTIGAGDTVQGAVLAWLTRHRVADVAALSAAECRAMLGFAAHAAAVTVSRSGAEPPTADELPQGV
ncbi:carbohydrate kinase family protein [Saccharomonospora piscinae]|uniref:Carbohydrate kinase n=1 Tax=Saccharomonospora piscinae TaxID=687388 RepID=A0A1V9A6M1_SACPI|nr:carbohydrate kinase [Saccharomonospora piscinae]OQO92676.1 carbohydrate kinase [Saccharomonospora piscinae]TLW91618.1 carbohydrate kinase [Saccharomonospora piscinae]